MTIRGGNGARDWTLKGRFMLVIDNKCPANCNTKQLVVRASMDAWGGNFAGNQVGADGFNENVPDGEGWQPHIPRSQR